MANATPCHPLNTSIIPRPFGLMNPSVLCYFNSLTQALLSCADSNKFILDTRDENSGDVVALWTAFKQFVTDALSPTPPKDAINLINLLKGQLIADKRAAFGNGQEDAGEGVHLFIDSLKNSGYSALFEHKYVHDMYCPQCKTMVSSPTDVSIQVEIPHNYATLIGNWTDDDVPYSCILNKYIRHHIDEVRDYKCPRCSEVVVAHRVSHLIRSPQILIVMFNKFDRPVKWTTELPTHFVFPGNDEMVRYELVAKIEHFGNHRGGHYVAHALRYGSGDKPHLFNDVSVSPGNFATTANTYICIYHICYNVGADHRK